MSILHYCIQCKDIISGQIGTFAYDESRTPDDNTGFVAISPIFNGLVQFYDWAHANNWNSIPGVLDLIMFPTRETSYNLVDELKAAALNKSEAK